MELHFGLDLAPKLSQDSTFGAISILKQVVAVLFQIFGFTVLISFKLDVW